jgi:hypothetical protein
MIAAIEVELFVSLLLLSGALPRFAWSAVTALFATFSCVSTWNLLVGSSTCNCFGNQIVIRPGLMLIFDLVCLVSLFLTRQTVQKAVAVQQFSPLKRIVGMTFVFVAVGVPLALKVQHYSLTETDDPVTGATIDVQPSTWLQGPFPLLPLIDIGESLTSGHWMVILYSDACPHCRQLIDQLEPGIYQRELPADCRIAAVDILPGQSNYEPRGTRVYAGRIARSNRLNASVPIQVELQDGVVVAVR